MLFARSSGSWCDARHRPWHEQLQCGPEQGIELERGLSLAEFAQRALHLLLAEAHADERPERLLMRSLAALGVDVRVAEHQSRRLLVVGPAVEAGILHGRRAAQGKGLTMLDREEAPRTAAAALFVHERALPAVP